jgi:glycosyltransferase involved in cell wall biosynthesis
LIVASQLLHALEPLADAEPIRVSVVIPCLNEAENIVQCVALARQVLDDNELAGEVIVVDNGSQDGSAALAEKAGAIIVHEPRRGYGRAYQAGFAAALGDYIVMVDADLTYDFREIPRFVAELDSGAELVMGNRMQNIEPGAMPWLNRYVGNPMMSRSLNLLFRAGVRDPQCGMRALRREALPRLALESPGFEFASEMVFRAARAGLDVRQFPIRLHPRGGGVPKLSPLRDGWRNLRLMLMHNPNALFLLPGVVVALLGTFVSALAFAQASVFGHTFLIHTLIGGALLVVVGVQLLGFGLCGRVYVANQLPDRDAWLERWTARVRLEHGLLAGAGLMTVGTVLGAVVVGKWVAQGLGSLSEEKLTILAAMLVIVGVQVFFTSFLTSILAMRPRYRRLD